MSNSLIILPTYNERENIQKISEAILSLEQGFHILIIDDNSNDGTGEVADLLSKLHSEIQVIHRPGKLGLGTAYIAGFKFALQNNYDYIFEMDADLSHDPKYLALFLKKVHEGYDLVIGSRYIDGISVVNWDFKRLILSKSASKYVRLITKMPLTDATAGFKCFRRRVLEDINLDAIHSTGYSFQIEMSYRAYKRGFKISEIPIIFSGRFHGDTKMSKAIIWEAIWMVWRLRLGMYKKQPLT
ncbi:MAG: polyprenol monophosphomannose synthase [bacterium]